MASSAECNKSFSSDYMLLKLEEASMLEVTKILLFSDVAKRKFVDCPDGAMRKESFCHRWIIFISVVAQLILQAVSGPLAGLGDFVERCLNLLSVNNGFFGLLTNYFKGKVIPPPSKTSSKFLSAIANLDKRVELDSRMGYEDSRYNAALSIMASKVSYENENYVRDVVQNHWKMDFLGFYDFWNDYQGKTTTQAFAFQDKNDVITIAFRGTELFNADDWSSDVDISWYELPSVGKIHGGFMKALGLQRTYGWPKEQPPTNQETAYYGLRKLLKQTLLNNEKAKFIVTGHSLGGALAVLFPMVLALHEESFLLERLVGVYTFGQPRVGDKNFGEYMKKSIEKHSFNYRRFVYSFDLVPRIPFDDSAFLFKHSGTCIYYNSFYRAKVMIEEPDKNYFSIIWLIPKTLNAMWELIRSFIIPYTKGPEYKETAFLRFVRVLGLFVAGIPAHCPQDYVNATKLASPDVFLLKDQ